MDQVAGIPGQVGPAGPVGPVGPPGAGVDCCWQCRKALKTYHDYFEVIGEFWFTNDTNTLYFSAPDGWVDLGSPIQGKREDTTNQVLLTVQMVSTVSTVLMALKVLMVKRLDRNYYQ